MTDRPVLLEIRDDGIAVLTLNRPEKLNALNAEVRQLLKQHFLDMADDPAVRVVVIHGAGDKAFVAGADITEFHARTAEEHRLGLDLRSSLEGLAVRMPTSFEVRCSS